MTAIVKRAGHEEKFDERKVYASCYAACLSAGMKAEDAEKICEKVAGDLKKKVAKERLVSSNTIFTETVKAIKKYSKEAAFMYETHRDIA